MLPEGLDRLAEEHAFSGAVRVDRDGAVVLARAYGDAERGLGVPNTLDTQFAVASASKGFTALTVMSLVEEGALSLDTPARSLLGDDLPEIDERVTVGHLLVHRSGIGDYLDESAGFDVADYVLLQPVHRFTTTEAFLPELAGHPQEFPPGERFAYCNGGYMVLALLAERASGESFHDLVHDRVCAPAGLADTGFLRSDELPGRAARGYLEATGLRTNVLHLPVRGNGDGGLYTTVADFHRFWQALFAGAIVSSATVADMLTARSDVPEEEAHYGLGFWLRAGRDAPYLEGYDAGVSFHSMADRSTGTVWTVVSNTSEGAWRIAGYVAAALSD